MFGGLSLGWLLRSPVKLTEDSAEFLQALTLWHPWIAAACPTPRLVKRFLNRVRLAMRYRPPEPAPVPRFQRTRDKLTRSAPEEPAAAESAFDERVLVALSAIYEFHRDWVIDDSLFGQLSNGKPEQFVCDEIFETEKTNGLAKDANRALRQINQSSLLNPLTGLSDQDRENIHPISGSCPRVDMIAY